MNLTGELPDIGALGGQNEVGLVDFTDNDFLGEAPRELTALCERPDITCRGVQYNPEEAEGGCSAFFSGRTFEKRCVACPEDRTWQLTLFAIIGVLILSI